MIAKEHMHNGVSIVIVQAQKAENGAKLMGDTQSALDLMSTIRYQYNTDRIAIDKRAIANDFFILSSGIAGEILQKFINYGLKMAIYGDFSRYTSKPLQDFMRESNNGREFFFVKDQREAIAKLVAAK